MAGEGNKPDATPGDGAPLLILGGAADVIPERIAPRSLDMVYSDPPFGNDQIWTGTAGSFSDKWEWGRDAALGWERLRRHSSSGADLIAAATPLPRDRAYLGMIAGVLLSVREALKLTGTLWLHFDDTMGAHLRVLGDVVFGPDNQVGTVVWKRSSGRATRHGFARIHDTIACFGRTRASRARLARIGDRDLVHGGWDCPVKVDALLNDQLTASSAERVGYPTQKPLTLVRRFIRAATLPGDIVLDPTCGSGTTLVAARIEGRRAIGIDTSADALITARDRLMMPTRPQLELFA
jgi:hypothetical protein